MESEKSLVGKVSTSWGWESGAAMQGDVFSLCSSVSRGLEWGGFDRKEDSKGKPQ